MTNSARARLQGGRLAELRAMYAEKEKLISIGVSEAAAVEDIRKEFSGRALTA